MPFGVPICVSADYSMRSLAFTNLQIPGTHLLQTCEDHVIHARSGPPQKKTKIQCAAKPLEVDLANPQRKTLTKNNQAPMRPPGPTYMELV